MADTDLIVYQDQGTVTKVKLFETGDGEYSHMPLNQETWGVRTIEHEEAEINIGDHYFVTNYTTLSSDGVFAVGIVTPNTTEWAHIGWKFRSIGQMTAQIFESATFTSSDWTPITPQNSNRNSANTSVLTVVSNTAFTDSDGTLLAAFSMGDGTNPANMDGGQTSKEEKIILKQNTQYVFKITSQTASNIISYTYQWYEHTDKA